MTALSQPCSLDKNISLPRRCFEPPIFCPADRAHHIRRPHLMRVCRSELRRRFVVRGEKRLASAIGEVGSDIIFRDFQRRSNLHNVPRECSGAIIRHSTQRRAVPSRCYALCCYLAFSVEKFRTQTNITVPFGGVSGRAIMVTHSVLKRPFTWQTRRHRAPKAQPRTHRIDPGVPTACYVTCENNAEWPKR